MPRGHTLPRPEKWNRIVEVAIALGLSRSNTAQWICRGAIPAKHINAIFMETNGAISHADMVIQANKEVKMNVERNLAATSIVDWLHVGKGDAL
jgi:DNA-binding transcriptional regulator YdaS (Cro superfamily)